MTQLATILKHVRSRGSISNVEAQAVHCIRALPRRIADLEERGYLFKRDRMTDVNGQRYVRYIFKGHRDNASKYLRLVRARLTASA